MEKQIVKAGVVITFSDLKEWYLELTPIQLQTTLLALGIEFLDDSRYRVLEDSTLESVMIPNLKSIHIAKNTNLGQKLK